MLLLLALQLMAQGPNGTGTYYQNADGEKGSALKTAMWAIIKDPQTVGYSGLWNAYRTTDKRDDGKVWDMYSSITNYDFDDHGSSFPYEGSGYNREHSFPRSWFGGEVEPMNSDVMHIVPTDGYVNNRRNNYPFGETTNPTDTSDGGFSKLGPSSISGYSGTVFEPNDEYKGDFARIYFYMATCYEDQIDTWSSPMLSGDEYKPYQDWALNMLLRWAAEDPVSQKEIDRNNAVYELQGNRNPYVDYPGLEQYVWGEYKDKAFSYDNYEEPDITGDPDDPIDPPVSDSRTFTKVTSQSQLSPEYTYLIVYESDAVAMGATEKTYRSPINVTLSGNTITTDVNGNGQPRAFNLGGTVGAYTLYDGVDKVYLALNKANKQIDGNATATTNKEKWTITIDNGTCEIANNEYDGWSIQYNKQSPRFTCYSSKQEAVTLYKSTTTTGITDVIVADGNEKVDVYTITGMKVRSQVTRDDALDGLEKGVYIIGNKKYLVR